MWLYGKEPLKVSQDSGRFGDDKHCGSGDILDWNCHVILLDKMNLIYHVILQDHVSKGSSSFMGRSPSR